MKHDIDIAPGLTLRDGGRLLLIAGPCQIESLEHSLMIAHRLIKICDKLPVDLVFKSSFDKANRTSLTGTRGLGMHAGLEILSRVKSETGLPLITDVHSVDQISAVSQVVDILQTPAFLCRQTDLLQAAGESGKCVNIKKGQFLHPDDMTHAAAKVASSGNDKILLCERGSCFGYRDLVVDPRSLTLLKRIGYPVILDITHSVQSMGGAGGASGGSREFIPTIALVGAALAVDGMFIECHENPQLAPSDSASMLPLDQLKSLLLQIIRVREAALERP